MRISEQELIGEIEMFVLYQVSDPQTFYSDSRIGIDFQFPNLVLSDIIINKKSINYTLAVKHILKNTFSPGGCTQSECCFIT